jgi:Fibronectin type III domain/Beta-propeller repeat
MGHLIAVVVTLALSCGVSLAGDEPTQLHRLYTQPVAFEPNQGQTSPEALFLSRGPGWMLFLASNKATLNVERRIDATPAVAAGGGRVEGITFGLSVIGGRAAEITPERPLQGKTNYILTKDRSKWHVNIPQYQAVRYKRILPGIDLVYYGNPQQLEHDFVVSAGADPRKIRFRVDGADQVTLDPDGALVLKSKTGDLKLQKPIAYQDVTSGKVSVEAQFNILADNTVGFRLGAYDPDKELVIDPILTYSSYIGGSVNGATGYSVATDSAGNAYIAGSTFETDFPTTAGAYSRNCTPVNQNSCNGPWVFVSKFDPNTSGNASIVYSTYLGQSHEIAAGQAVGIAVDASGSAYLTGGTADPNFPTTPGALNTAFGSGGEPAFLTKLAPDGATLLYSTFLGTSGNLAQGVSIAVDSSGNAYVAGTTVYLGSSFPTTPGVVQPNCQPIGGCGYDVFVAKVNASGSAFAYSTLLGGAGSDYAAGLAIDSNGNAHVTGFTYSTDFPTTSGSYQSVLPPKDPVLCPSPGRCYSGFVTKLNPTATSMAYSTYLTGDYADLPSSIALDPSTNAYIGFHFVQSSNFGTPGAFQTTCSTACVGGSTSAGIASLSTDGTALRFATYLHGTGSGSDQVRGISVNALGEVYATGVAGHTDFPITSNAIQSSYGLGFLAKLDPTLSSLLYSSFLGGPSTNGNAIALDSNSNIYLTGTTADALAFPITANAFQATLASDQGSAFLTKMVEDPPAPTNLAAIPNSSSSVNLSWTDNSINEDFFLIEQSSDGAAFAQIASIPANATNTASYSVSGLNSNQQYWFRVRAANGAGNSAYTNVATATTLGAAAVGLTATSLNFGQRQINGGPYPIPQVHLTNTGGAPLLISSIALNGTNPGDFTDVNNCPISPNALAAGDSCSIIIDFGPSAVGPRSASIRITDDVSDSPQSISLSGVGVDFSVSAVPDSISIHGRKKANYTITVAPLGGNTSDVQLSLSSCPQDATCVLSPTSVTLNGTANSTSTLTITPGKLTSSLFYSLQLIGSSNGASRSARVTWIVQ